MRRDVTIDWTVRDDVKAKLRSSIINYDCPPDKQTLPSAATGPTRSSRPRLSPPRRAPAVGVLTASQLRCGRAEAAGHKATECAVSDRIPERRRVGGCGVDVCGRYWGLRITAVRVSAHRRRGGASPWLLRAFGDVWV